MPIVKKIQRVQRPAACAAIREARYDMTDFVVHVTPSLRTLLKILNAGYIEASFSSMTNKYEATPKPTIRGQRPVVCFTDQPLWALLDTMRVSSYRWSGYGIAYHKVPLSQNGGRPVWYVSPSELGSEVREGHRLYRKGFRIHDGSIPVEHQYRCVLYSPHYSDMDLDQIDFTCEREWRIKWPNNKLPLYLDWPSRRDGAIIVRHDEDVVVIKKALKELRKDESNKWVSKLSTVLSLESAERMLEKNDKRYGRIETWPFPKAK